MAHGGEPREFLPVPNQHLLPDDLPDDLGADAEQHGERAVGVVEAVQQNFHHPSLLLSYQPVMISSENLRFKV